MVDFIGHIGYVFLVFGTLLIGLQKIAGWPLLVVGEVIWVVLGIVLGLTSIWFWGIVFVGIDGYGWYRWRAKSVARTGG